MQLLTTVTGMSHSETQNPNNFKSNLKQSNRAIKQWLVYIPIQSFCSDLLMGSMVHEVWIESYENIIFLLKY